MANPEWLEIFRSYEPSELEEKITELKGQISVFVSQQVGQKNYTKDLAELRGQLSAAVRVRNERRGNRGPRSWVTDFRG